MKHFKIKSIYAVISPEKIETDWISTNDRPTLQEDGNTCVGIGLNDSATGTQVYKSVSEDTLNAENHFESVVSEIPEPVIQIVFFVFIWKIRTFNWRKHCDLSDWSGRDGYVSLWMVLGIEYPDRNILCRRTTHRRCWADYVPKLGSLNFT